MAIEKNNFKASRFDLEFSAGSRKSMSSDEDELPRRSSAAESDDDDEFDDADSGAGSDDFDLLELGETGVEFCQIGNETCSIPFELYELPGLEDILSMDVWNECLSEEERFGLTKFLPDMDQETFMITMKELFTGCDFHFGSPIKRLFGMLKGGLCEPRVALYREGLNFFQKRQHYHLLRKHQNNMVSILCQTRDAWLNCKGYSIGEKLRLLNIMKTQKSLMSEKMDRLESDSSDRESSDGLRSTRMTDRKVSQRVIRSSDMGSPLDFSSRRGLQAMELEKSEKQNSRGTLKLAGSKMPSTKKLVGHSPSVYHGLDMNSGPYGLPRSSRAGGYDSRAVFGARDRMRNIDDSEEGMYSLGAQRDRNMAHSSGMDKSGVPKMAKKRGFLGGERLVMDAFLGAPLPTVKADLYSRNRNPSLFPGELNMRTSFDYGKKAKYVENVQQYSVGDQIKSAKGRVPQLPLKGTRIGPAEPFWHKKTQGEAFSMDPPFKSDERDPRSKKWKTGRDSPDFSYKTYRSPSPQLSDRFIHSENVRAKLFQERNRGRFLQDGGPNITVFNGEETESDSSEQFEDEDSNPFLRSKLAYPGGVMEVPQSSFLKSGLDAKKTKYVKKEMKENTKALDGITYSSKNIAAFVEHGEMPVGEYSMKTKQKGKFRPLQDASTTVMGDDYPSLTGKYNDDDDVDEKIKNYKVSKNGRLHVESSEKADISALKAFPFDGKQKGKSGGNHSVTRFKNLREFVADEEEDSLEMQLLPDSERVDRYGKKGSNTERSEVPLQGCNSVNKKRKGRGEDLTEMEGKDDNGEKQHNLGQIDESTKLKKKAKKRPEPETGISEMETTSDPPVAEIGGTVELENKPQKNPFTPIMPTVHTGFSFSIVHLLSAVRLAMITLLPEDTIVVGKSMEDQNQMHGDDDEKAEDVNNLDQSQTGKSNVPSFSVQEIVTRVRSNPVDPCILETQEPLQDLVRGVLKIFSSKTAPLGAKGWKSLAIYERSSKTWAWIGPVSPSLSSEQEPIIEEVVSPEAWGVPHKMLVKLVDSFANWLKSGQETLQQIGSLPDPPLALMQFNLDEKERFRDLRAQKSLSTISPCSEEVRSYFRKEELLRYSIPDRAFSYTAADGKKSIVAPLRRCGGKPTSKARDHFMLKRDRPPHVTILCLVRDAAARLPGSIGTRADVCTLIRDSQYIVEDVSDAQVNQVVSGALDRLHYERDPCVQFDGERKLWVYLHREREEEDFEDDGTSSTKKWKRQKKDPEQSEQGMVTVAFHGAEEQSGYDLCSDLNLEPSSLLNDKGLLENVFDDDVRPNLEEDVNVNNGGSEEGEKNEDSPMVWTALDMNPKQERRLMCQENSTNEDFGDDSFGRERPVGLLSTRIL